jgi:hypothetical protein
MGLGVKDCREAAVFLYGKDREEAQWSEAFLHVGF